MTMQIVSASYNTPEQTSINVVLAEPPDTTVTVPADPANKDYVELQAWAAEPGNLIAPYVAPPPDPELARIAALLAVPAVVELVGVLKNYPEGIDNWCDDNATSAIELRLAFRTLLKLLAAKVP